MSGDLGAAVVAGETATQAFGAPEQAPAQPKLFSMAAGGILNTNARVACAGATRPLPSLLTGRADRVAKAEVASQECKAPRLPAQPPTPRDDASDDQSDHDDNVSPEALPSAGSALHADGTCTQCCFFAKGRCRNGIDCEFCHLPHDKRARGRGCRGRGGSRAAAAAAAVAVTAAPTTPPATSPPVPPPGLDPPSPTATPVPAPTAATTGAGVLSTVPLGCRPAGITSTAPAPIAAPGSSAAVGVGAFVPKGSLDLAPGRSLFATPAPPQAPPKTPPAAMAAAALASTCVSAMTTATATAVAAPPPSPGMVRPDAALRATPPALQQAVYGEAPGMDASGPGAPRAPRPLFGTMPPSAAAAPTARPSALMPPVVAGPVLLGGGASQEPLKVALPAGRSAAKAHLESLKLAPLKKRVPQWEI
mmetsp:Transcript_81511/g.235545  ORF Transcript_81511/g.235545 Transcript_81511/m.235545 type:complete len:420 (+) Transcript_81511:99-1358(+)